MKGGCETATMPQVTKDEYPYPRWTPRELEVLGRWYCVLGPKQCSDMWESFTGRSRTFEQLANKTKNGGMKDNIPDDFMELFDGT